MFLFLSFFPLFQNINVSLKWVYLNEISVLHLKADHLNFEDGCGFEMAVNAQTPPCFYDECLRLSQIHLDSDELTTSSTVRLDCGSIEELLSLIDESKSLLLSQIEKYEYLKLGQNCLAFIEEMVEICKGRRYYKSAICIKILKTYKKVRKIKRSYDNFMKKLYDFKDKLLGVRAVINSYKMNCRDFIFIETRDKTVALKLQREVREYSAFQTERLYSLYKYYSWRYCDPFKLYWLKDKLLCFKPSVHFKNGTKPARRRHSYGRRYSQIRNEAYPLKNRSRSNSNIPESNQSSPSSSSTSNTPSTSSRGYLNPTISYINKIRNKKSK
ncbi:large glycine-rich repeat low complexity [Cryptosporidium sp. chipmunk genotype I]|uniref:large glycine-rich repeat low complexity n=1 Tax=Cryptosporidium sp. chipmunk genotype I TaxID=1280935 RepID=UPI00351A6310|nr:large glycine-rich repeat low complexity [Cryptosporidium sp. chipmunk genotype I]